MKKASCAVMRLRRSDLIALRYAFALLFVSLGIAIKARMPMITMTMSSSSTVKPLRVRGMDSSWRDAPDRVLLTTVTRRNSDCRHMCLHRLADRLGVATGNCNNSRKPDLTALFDDVRIAPCQAAGCQ